MQGLKMVKTVELESVLHRVLELLPKDSISEDMLLEWAYQAYESIASAEVYEVDVAVIEVINNMVTLPKGLFGLELVLYNTSTVNDSTEGNLPCGDAIVGTNNDVTCETTTDINTGCNTVTVTNTTLTTYKDVSLNTNHPVYVADNTESTNPYELDIVKHQVKYKYPIKHNTWKPLIPSSNSFMRGMFVGLPRHVFAGCKESFSLYKGCLMTSFQSGLVAIAYTRMPMNDEGKYVIPDLESVSRAIETFLKKRYWEWRMNLKDDGAYERYKQYSTEYELLAMKATGEMMMPTLMEYQRLRNMNKFFSEDSPFAIGMGASNSAGYVFLNNTHNNNPLIYGIR